MRKLFWNFLAALGNRKIIEKFLLASLKTHTNSKDCYESRIRISVPAFLRCHWSIFSSVHVLSGFRNNIFTGGCLKPGTSFIKRVIRMIFRIMYWFHRCKEKLYFKFCLKKGSQMLWKLAALIQNVLNTDLIFRTLKKYLSCDPVPWTFFMDTDCIYQNSKISNYFFNILAESTMEKLHVNQLIRIRTFLIIQHLDPNL
jgi:hypothetical protein